uniref:Putative secreted protein n=1 Tax=Anopheles marajoara TaxID=58244 RepID=A0A2M4C8A1_9DIPT
MILSLSLSTIFLLLNLQITLHQTRTYVLLRRTFRVLARELNNSGTIYCNQENGGRHISLLNGDSHVIGFMLMLVVQMVVHRSISHHEAEITEVGSSYVANSSGS